MPSRHRRLLPWLALFTIWIVWGSTYLAIRVVVRELPPFAAGSLRFLVAGLAMGVIAVVADRRHGWPDRRRWLDYGVIGVLFLGIGNGIVMWSEQRIPSGITALIVAMVPLWITLLDGLRPNGQPWTTRVWLGTLVGFAGVLLVARPEKGVEAGHWPAVAVLQLACLSWTVGALYSQSVPRRLPVFTASAIEMIAGSLALLVESRLFGEDLAAFRSASSDAWLGLLYLVAFGSLVGFTAFAYALNELPASTVGTYAYVNPVVAVALGSVFLAEPLSAGLLAGAALILAAVILTTRHPRRGTGPTAPKALSRTPVGEGSASA
jgi:drug/metabolite transporter (DMT)-like permease